MSDRGSLGAVRKARLQPVATAKSARRRRNAKVAGGNVFARAPVGGRGLALPAVKYLKHGPKRG